jgi:antirestriction protein
MQQQQNLIENQYNPALAADSCQIYVACLASYNNGYLHGKWINVNQDPDDVKGAIFEMLAGSPYEGAEEWAIHDHEGFESVQIEEYTGIDEVCQKASFIKEHGELGSAVLAHCCGDIEHAEESLTDHYHGAYDSEEDFAGEIFDLCHPEIPKQVRWYVDEKLYARDLFINDYFSVEVGRMIHVFSYH